MQAFQVDRGTRAEGQVGRVEHGGEWPGVMHTVRAQSMLVALGICMWASWAGEAIPMLTAWFSEPR